MSYAYDQYLAQHRANVSEAFYWIRDNLPELIDDEFEYYEHQICYAHDYSKNKPEEYAAYDAYFYGHNRSYAVVQDFKTAWLRHIHQNPHHWQYWILFNDEPGEGCELMEIPYCYILEMICDWWSFSWGKDDLTEIFGWYDKRKDYMRINSKSRAIIEDILRKIAAKLEFEWVVGGVEKAENDVEDVAGDVLEA